MSKLFKILSASLLGLLLIVLLFFMSSKLNHTLVKYTIDKKVFSVSVKKSLTDLEEIFGQLAPEDMERIKEDQDFRQMVILSRLVEPELLTIEAKKISNYSEDPAYQASMEKQEKLLPYIIALQDGQKKIDDELNNKTVEVAEVSRIMFTNSGNPEIDAQTLKKAEEILAVLDTSEDLVVEFANIAEKESHEPLGVQNGGYLGQIARGSHLPMDPVVFDKKSEGLVSEVITNELGSYIVLVHTKAEKIKVSKLDQYAFASSLAQMKQQFIASNVQYLFTLDGDNVVIKDKVIPSAELTDDVKLIKFWKKTYTLGDIKSLLDIFSGGNPMQMSNGIILQQLLSSPKNIVTPLTYQMAIVYRAYSPSISKTKQFKKDLAAEQRNIELQTVYSIMSQELYKDISTNVTEAEMKKYYEIPANRPIASYNDKDEPVYKTFTQSKEELSRSILNERARRKQDEYKEQLSNTYKITWSEKGQEIFTKELPKVYQKYQEEMEIY